MVCSAFLVSSPWERYAFDFLTVAWSDALSAFLFQMRPAAPEDGDRQQEHPTCRPEWLPRGTLAVTKQKEQQSKLVTR